MIMRQPIVSVLGHVDHGKTTLLDYIRGSGKGLGVADREAGKITQHIGATEVPLETINGICSPVLGGREFTVPGLLFIDTPGHHSFTTLRARGGSLADLAVLIVDAVEGFKPQTIESIRILKRYKTPFVVALNKLDRLPMWREHPKACFMDSLGDQAEGVPEKLDEHLYKIVEKLHHEGFSSERFDRVSDFQRNVAIVPICARSGEGVADLLLVLVGLAQRFLEKRLESEEGSGEGTVLEIKEEKGLGTTLDTIVYKGTVKKGDTVVIGTIHRPIVTKIKALLKPNALDEIRDPRERFQSVDAVSAAAGVKIIAQGLDEVIAGAPIRVAGDNVDQLVEELSKEQELTVELADDGVFLKADAIGSLEALAYECKDAGIPVKMAQLGNISRRDIISAETIQDPLRRAVLAFGVQMLPDAKEQLLESEAKLFEGDIIYRIIEDYVEWYKQAKVAKEELSRDTLVYPGKYTVLPNCVFRVSKPAVVGVRVLAGRIRQGQGILREDGRVVGKIKSIQTEGKSLKEAIQGAEVAISVAGVTVGRQISVDDVLYTDMPGSNARTLGDIELNFDEKQTLEEIIKIKRKDEPFWGM